MKAIKSGNKHETEHVVIPKEEWLNATMRRHLRAYYEPFNRLLMLLVSELGNMTDVVQS